MSAKKKLLQQAQEPKQEPARAFICPACVKNEKTKGLVCTKCRESHQQEVMLRIGKHQPVRSLLDFALDAAEQNLNDFAKELDEKMGETRPFFASAHQEVSKELRRVGVRLPKEKFLEAVKERYHEIMVKAGQKELYERSEWLKEMVYSLESQMNWMKKLEANQAAEKSKEETEIGATEDVSETAAVA